MSTEATLLRTEGPMQLVRVSRQDPTPHRVAVTPARMLSNEVG
jgi:hypothetical protein